MSRVELFLDDTPGETRGVLVREGRYERLLIQRDDDPLHQRLGARIAGRVSEVSAGLRGAFVDIGDGDAGFLPFAAGPRPRVGDRLEVEVTAERRAGKGATLRALGPATGQGVRLLEAGPDAPEALSVWAPGVEVRTGREAIEAGWAAAEAALETTVRRPELGLDVAVERTRALVAVDIDHTPPPGRDPHAARERANREGLAEAARLIRLKGWGGLVALDLVGGRLNPAAVEAAARAAFAADGAAIGPLSRFGLLQLSLPWTRTPVEERLRSDLAGRAIDIVRRLRHRLLADTATPVHVMACAPEEASAAARGVARLGPRAALRPDPAVPPGQAAFVEA
ncbi:MAG TPA: ribonuclease E/G [Brevundimonas sp.]|uniref:ribonuclease E/G n=1 Tax=Brevundimonas sp. TaxID=1871086 RepID=UPI002E0E71B5|nr:ribonuclease E/G [Brevundimonas sp.]